LGGIVLSDLRAETRSILEDKGEKKLIGQKGQLLLPGTVRTLLLAAFGLLLFPPIVLKLYRGVLAVMKSYRIFRQRRLPHSRIMHALNRLIRRLSECDPPVFFTQISKLLREYISGRLNIPALTSTTLELQVILPQALSQEQPSEQTRAVASDIIALLRRADYVRFGGRSASEEEMEEALHEVTSFVEKVEGVIQRVES
jgi:hypothetical protein